MTRAPDRDSERALLPANGAGLVDGNGTAPAVPISRHDSRRRGKATPRRGGSRAAQNRARTLRNGKDFPPHKDQLLAITARLIVHFENVSNRLYADTETMAEGEPRQLLSRAIDLSRQVAENLARIFPQGDDPFA